MNYLKVILISSLLFFTVLFSSCSPNKKIPPPRPNILFCIADDATFQHMGAYGCDWVKTPAFDRVADQGLLFANAYTPNAKCAPSRSCILTGRNSWQLEEAANHWCLFPVKFRTYAETLGENGYHTGFTAKGLAPVVALTEDGKKRPVLGKRYNDKKLVPPTRGISKVDYSANFVDFLNDNPEGKPFCFWYGGFEPHRSYEYGSGIKKGNKTKSEIDRVYSFWPDNDTVRTDLLDYAYEIEYFDSHLEKMLAELEKRGLLENTIVIVTADNGMPFPRIKGQAYEYSNHLPLAIMWKNGIKKPGRLIQDYVSFIDFAPTFLELAGVDQSVSQMKPIEGKSLTDILYSEQGEHVSPERDHVLIGKERHDVGRPDDWGYPIRGIRKGDYLFVINFETTRWPSGDPITGYLNCDGSPTKSFILFDRREKGQTLLWDLCFGKRPGKELYNVKDDPDCMNNLMNTPGHEKLAETLESQLLKELKEQKDPRMFGQGHIFDEYQSANKNERDFYNRFMRGENPRAGWVNKTDFEPPGQMKVINMDLSGK